MSSPRPAPPAALTDAPPRQRLLAAARDLFYRQGIHAVGVEAIAEAARTNKMTLYRHFGSKDELVAAYLQELADEADAAWQESARRHPDPRQRLEAWIHEVGAHATCSGSARGCALANAVAELPDPGHPARKVVERHKQAQRERLAALCRDAGSPDPGCTADQMLLLVEGARVSLQSSGASGPGARLVPLLEALLPAGRRSPGRRR